MMVLQYPRTTIAGMATLFVCLSFIIGSATGAEVAKDVDNTPGGSTTQFPEGMFGVWYPTKNVTNKAILGPLSYDLLAFHKGGFSAMRDRRTGDVWFTILMGQVFHVSGNKMQYCFGEVILFEQSPFSMHAVDENSVTFCWRTGLRGMPTQARGCSGCGCAKMLIKLVDHDTLHLQFWMGGEEKAAPLHLDMTLARKDPEPSFMNAVWPLMPYPYQQCTFRDHYGPNIPGEPPLGPHMGMKMPGGCARTVVKMARTNPDFASLLEEVSASTDNVDVGAGTGRCHQLNGFNFLWNTFAKRAMPWHAMDVADVRLQYKKPPSRCDPCDVSYSVSAKIREDEYIAVGFKGQSWEGKFPYPPEHEFRPCYFGMCVDSYDNYTSDRIALGYASSAAGGCVREMVSPNVVGVPKDVDYKILRQTSVERAGGRTILRFTVSQHWVKKTLDGMRVMWAVGKVPSNGGCVGEVGFHFTQRGVSPIDWLGVIGSTPCRYSHFEMGDRSLDVPHFGIQANSNVVV